jgi:acid phosphatase (class A)
MTTTWRKYACLILTVFLAVSSAVASSDDNYLLVNEIPNPLAYLPPAPDSSHIMRNGDFARWTWGKAMRDTPRGEVANRDSKFGIVRMCEIYSGLLGIDISEENTPAIYRLMLRSGETGASGVSTMKNTYFRKRPFLVFNEPVWGQFDSYENLSTNSSYPSSHTSFAWGTTLALAEMAPHLQDTILGRGYEYGISRVIVGAHWQSDVDAAFLCASAAMARAHATDEYVADLAAARDEYLSLKGLSEGDISSSTAPSALKILEAPALNDSYFFYGEVAPYWQAKAERDTERGIQAVADANLGDDAIISGFASCTSVPLSNATTPHIASLIKTVKLMLGLHATVMKNYWYRNRPYVEMGDDTSVPGDEAEYYNDSSYPSGHAVIGWGLALVLAEVMPDCQDAILKRGYDFGWSRVITGYHYPGDVQAGRVMAACVLAKIHNEPLFKNLLQAAKAEYMAYGTRGAAISTLDDAVIPPQPLDSASVGFSGDFYRWIWGKQQRDNEIGEQASHDSGCSFDDLCDIFGGVLSLNIGENSTPAIYSLMASAAQAGVDGCATMSPSSYRKRPFVLMNEQLWGENESQDVLSDSTSYPSIHAAMVWSTALALAQMAPQLQDTILARAMQCATSGVITGAHWQSDVDAALMCASAAMAMARATTQFAAMQTAAQNEYMQLTGLSASEQQAPFPSVSKILETPPLVSDIFFAGDVEGHWHAALLRDTERGALAVADASLDDDYLIDIINECSPVVTISETETPHVVALIKTAKFIFSNQATSIKSSIHRIRPYVQLNEGAQYGSEEWKLYGKSSYPSRHGMIGWGLAMTLAEVMTDCKQAILERGYEYGESRIIKGMCYPRDVFDARIIVACDMGKLHNEPFFNSLLDNAKKEYQQKLDDAAVETIIADSAINTNAWYTVNGIMLQSKPTTPGIYIHNGKKHLIK